MDNIFIVIGGPNGSGKTTFANAFRKKYPYPYVNADEIAREMNPEAPEKVQLKAGRKFFEEVSELIENNRNFIVESTLSGRYLARVIREVKAKNYLLVMVFVYLETPETCIGRIRERLLKGGHFVPDEFVIRRFHRSKNNFWKEYKHHAEQWFVVYNSEQRFMEVVFGEKDDFFVNSNELFQQFLSDIEE